MQEHTTTERRSFKAFADDALIGDFPELKYDPTDMQRKAAIGRAAEFILKIARIEGTHAYATDPDGVVIYERTKAAGSR